MPKRARPGTEDELVFLPLGGSGEIGMNLNLYGFGPAHARQWIMVDLGVTFGDARTPGVDLIMPDPAFISGLKDQLLGLVLTHGHEDHIGAVGHLWPDLQCPIYATPFTSHLVRGKLVELGLEDDAEITEIPLGGRFELGPFNIEFITLTHSIPEPNALAIRTPLGCVLHTGDWKIDPDPLVGDATDENALRALGEEGVLAMVCDSTNVFVPGEAGSEADVRASLMEVVGALQGKVAVACFASNVARLETVLKVAAANDRHVCLVGRSMHRMMEAARSVGMLNDAPLLVDEEEAGYLPHDHVLYLCTGSQGEPRAALSRIAGGTHRHVSLGEGDTVVFSSRVIPGNEIAIYDLQNALAESGVRIITEKDHFVHVSGHPCRDELAAMYQWIQPHLAVPVHGERRHLLEHGALTQELQIPSTVVPKNGTLVRLAPGPGAIIDEVPNGRLYLDGRVLLSDDSAHLRERKKISYSGFVGLSVAVSEDGDVLSAPRAKFKGIPDFGIDDDSLLVKVEREAEAALDRLSRKKRRDEFVLDQVLRRAARRTVEETWGKKPVVDVFVNWV